MNKVTTLAGLKHYFKAGGTATLVAHLHHSVSGEVFDVSQRHAALGVRRKPCKVQGNAVAFESVLEPGEASWLYYGNASSWTFDGNTARVRTGHSELVYELNDVEE